MPDLVGAILAGPFILVFWAASIYFTVHVYRELTK